MTYLIFKMGVFILLAIAFGVAIGFAFRNNTAKRETADVAAVLHDTQARIPQLETQLRSREQRVDKLKRDVEIWKEKIPPIAAQLEEREATLRQREKELHALKQSVANGEPIGEFAAAVGEPATDTVAEERVTHLETEVASKTAALAKAAAALADEQRAVTELRREIESQSSEAAMMRRQRETLARENETLRAERDRLQKSIEIIGEQLTNARGGKGQSHSELAPGDAGSPEAAAGTR